MMRYGRGITTPSNNRRGGIFYMVAGKNNPYENFNEVGGYSPLSSVVGEVNDEEENEKIMDTDDYLNAVRRRFENYEKGKRRKNRKFRYGLLDVENPMYIQGSFGYPKFNESAFSVKAYLLLTGRKDLANDDQAVDRMMSGVLNGEMTYNNLERVVARLAKEKGYDAIVWNDEEKPLEIFYFGNNKVKWLD